MSDDEVWTAHPARALTPRERAVVRHLAAALPREVDAQIEALAVVGSCRCGCGSLGLDVGDAAPVPATVVAALGGHNLEAVAATSRTAAGVTVALHLVGGRLVEVELYAGEGVPTTLPDVDELGVVEVG